MSRGLDTNYQRELAQKRRKEQAKQFQLAAEIGPHIPDNHLFDQPVKRSDSDVDTKVHAVLGCIDDIKPWLSSTSHLLGINPLEQPSTPVGNKKNPFTQEQSKLQRERPHDVQRISKSSEAWATLNSNTSNQSMPNPISSKQGAEKESQNLKHSSSSSLVNGRGGGDIGKPAKPTPEVHKIKLQEYQEIKRRQALGLKSNHNLPPLKIGGNENSSDPKDVEAMLAEMRCLPPVTAIQTPRKEEKFPFPKVENGHLSSLRIKTENEKETDRQSMVSIPNKQQSEEKKVAKEMTHDPVVMDTDSILQNMKTEMPFGLSPIKDPTDKNSGQKTSSVESGTFHVKDDLNLSDEEDDDLSDQEQSPEKPVPSLGVRSSVQSMQVSATSATKDHKAPVKEQKDTDMSSNEGESGSEDSDSEEGEESEKDQDSESQSSSSDEEEEEKVKPPVKEKPAPTLQSKSPQPGGEQKAHWGLSYFIKPNNGSSCLINSAAPSEKKSNSPSSVKEQNDQILDSVIENFVAKDNKHEDVHNESDDDHGSSHEKPAEISDSSSNSSSSDSDSGNEDGDEDEDENFKGKRWQGKIPTPSKNSNHNNDSYSKVPVPNPKPSKSRKNSSSSLASLSNRTPSDSSPASYLKTPPRRQYNSPHKKPLPSAASSEGKSKQKTPKSSVFCNSDSDSDLERCATPQHEEEVDVISFTPEKTPSKNAAKRLVDLGKTPPPPSLSSPSRSKSKSDHRKRQSSESSSSHVYNPSHSSSATSSSSSSSKSKTPKERGRKRHKGDYNAPSEPSQPPVAVVAPMKNEEKTSHNSSIEKLLQEVRPQDRALLSPIPDLPEKNKNPFERLVSPKKTCYPEGISVKDGKPSLIVHLDKILVAQLAKQTETWRKSLDSFKGERKRSSSSESIAETVCGMDSLDEDVMQESEDEAFDENLNKKPVEKKPETPQSSGHSSASKSGGSSHKSSSSSKRKRDSDHTESTGSSKRSKGSHKSPSASPCVDKKNRSSEEKKKHRSRSTSRDSRASSTVSSRARSHHSSSRSKKTSKDSKTESQVKEEPTAAVPSSESLPSSGEPVLKKEGDWSLTLASDKKSSEERLESADVYLGRAKELKHEADGLSDKLAKSLLYTEAVLAFIQCGNAMEKEKICEVNKSFTMYKDTFRLISQTCRFRSSDQITEKEKILSVLSLRVQALLCLKLYKLKRSDTLKLKKVIDDHNKTMPKSNGIPGQPSPHQAGWGARAGGGTPSSLSPAPAQSPSGSIGSVGSQGSTDLTPSRMMNGSLSSSMSSPGSVAVPTRIHSITQQYLSSVSNVVMCHEFWEQADMAQLQHQDFFHELEASKGKITMQSSISELVQYVKQGLQKLKSLA